LRLFCFQPSAILPIAPSPLTPLPFLPPRKQ
jgi:hypothetical protein